LSILEISMPKLISNYNDNTSTVVGGGYSFRQFRGFVFNLKFDKTPGENHWESPCSARVLIGQILTYQIYDIIDKKICILRKIELSNVFVPPPWRPQPWLRFNYWLDRTIFSPVYVNGIIVEK
jgi:hypothetical protein